MVFLTIWQRSLNILPSSMASWVPRTSVKASFASLMMSVMSSLAPSAAYFSLIFDSFP